MKTLLTLAAAGSLLAVIATAQPPRYTLIDLSTPPGDSFGQAFGVNNNRVVTGLETGSDGIQHAVLWYMGLGLKVNIGAPGLNSGAFGVNGLGEVEIQAESPAKDPNNENFCVYGTGLKCLPFLWQGGALVPLPLLGGNNGTVGQINNRGEVAGIAETATHDPACPTAVTVAGTGPQLLDYEAVVWGPAPGAIRKLSPLPGDTVGITLWINDNSQAVGSSGTCANSVLPPLAYGSHAVLWESDGSVTDLGNLGATTANIGLSINNQGQVSGASSLTANSTPFNGTDAFLWTKGTGMRDLGTLAGDVASGGQSINDAGEVVGLSVDPSGNPRAFVWQNGVMTDLNTLVPANASLFLLDALAINARGDIAGFGATSKGDIHPFLAVPSTVPSAVAHAASRIALSDDARKRIQKQALFGPTGVRFMGAR
jgi:probable HAF family extracellular repeat protein